MKKVIYTSHLEFRLEKRGMDAKTAANKKQEVDKDMKDSKKSIVNYDPSTDALYIVTREGEEEEFVEISPGINVELDSEGRVIGIEILNASDALSSIIEPLYRKRQHAG